MSIWGGIITEPPALRRADWRVAWRGGGACGESKFNPSRPDPQATKRIAFTVAVIALSAKILADGVGTRDEIAAFQARVHIPPAEVKQVGRLGSREAKPNGFDLPIG